MQFDIEKTNNDFVKLGDILYKYPNSNLWVKDFINNKNGKYPFYGANDKNLRTDEWIVDGTNIFVADGGKAIIKFYDGKASFSGHITAMRSNCPEQITTLYIFTFLKYNLRKIQSFFSGTTIQHLDKKKFDSMLIPIPSSENQKNILDCLETIEKIMDLNQKKYNILDNYRLSLARKMFGGKNE